MDDWGSESSYTTFTISGSGGNEHPTVAITAPADNEVFTEPADITITATASDSDGSIDKVEFFQGTTKLGEDTSPPYSFTWNSVSQGDYSLTAKATDNNGATTTSSVVNITVDPATSGGPYRYLRIKIINNLGDPSEVEYYDIDWFENDTRYNVGYFWGAATNLPLNIDKDLGQGVAITPTSLRFQNGYDRTHQAESFECYGSNDNTNWELFYSQSNLTVDDWGSESSYTTFIINPMSKTAASEETNVVPQSYTLLQNYPNPFNPETKIRYNLKQDSFVKLAVYNLLGQKVKILVDGFKQRGGHYAVWNGTDSADNFLPSGIYLYRIDIISDEILFTDIKKMILMK